MTAENSPFLKLTASGRPSTAMLARSWKVWSHWSEGLPQPSSPFMESRNGAPATRPVGMIAFQRTGGPGMMAISGCFGSST